LETSKEKFLVSFSKRANQLLTREHKKPFVKPELLCSYKTGLQALRLQPFVFIYSLFSLH
jgi:hypothetical protein